MFIKKFIKKFDIMAECKRYGLGFWQCPNSLFLIMGAVIIAAMSITYWVGTLFMEPELVIAIVSAVTIFLLIIGHSLVGSFARIAEANRMKSEFISIVSHQLRTPLSSLKWSVDLLLGKRLGSFNKKQKEYLDILNHSSIRMTRLVNDLLNVSRIEQGRLTIQIKAFSIEDLIEDIIKGLQVLAQAHNVEISFKDHKNLPNAYADPEKIRMVIQNLVDNAIKYSKKQGGVVEINTKIDKQKPNMIRVEVTDNGVGIPNMIQKQVFNKFFRGESLIKQKVEGTGLGLFIAKGIITISGGEIGFESHEGKGSVFWFTIPKAKDNN